MELGAEGPSSRFFQGETMHCILCPKVEKSDPAVDSGWRCLEADGWPYYVCPDHFPPAGSTQEAYRRAYQRALTKVLELRAGGPRRN